MLNTPVFCLRHDGCNFCSSIIKQNSVYYSSHDNILTEVFYFQTVLSIC